MQCMLNNELKCPGRLINCSFSNIYRSVPLHIIRKLNSNYVRLTAKIAGEHTPHEIQHEYTKSVMNYKCRAKILEF